MATKRLSAKAKRVKAAMYRPELEAVVDECAAVLAELNGGRPSGVRALMAAAPNEEMRRLVLAYEAEMNAQVAAAIRVGVCGYVETRCMQRATSLQAVMAPLGVCGGMNPL